jgi:putative ABC transport system permease protein
MTARDLLDLSFEALRAHRMRYALSALAVGVGVAAVVLLSSIGEGTRLFVQEQVSQFGTTIVGVHPGRVETSGMPGGAGSSARKLTIDDARALRRLPGVVDAVAAAYGTALVEHGSRGRRVFVCGVTSAVPRVWLMPVAAGTFLPAEDWHRSAPVVVLGPRVRAELFGDANPLGETVRVGEARFRVIGVMKSKGQYLGFDMDDTVFLTVADAMRLFNRSELSEVNLLAVTMEESEAVAARARRLMVERHGGKEDVTIVTQKDALTMVDNIMRILTLSVTAIAAISLLVGAIGIFTILWIVVGERIQEIGLVKALGATRAQITAWYLCEAAITAVSGGAAGLAVGMLGAAALGRWVPGLSAHTPPSIVAAAIGTALGVGLAAGIGPAIRAAALDPVEALRNE